jgi:hypothetical protein
VHLWLHEWTCTENLYTVPICELSNTENVHLITICMPHAIYICGQPKNSGRPHKDQGLELFISAVQPLVIWLSAHRTHEQGCDHSLTIQITYFNVNYLLTTYLLTKLSPSWEAANCAATQELPNILLNPKVHYRFHKSPPLVPILSQIDPVHTFPSYPSKICFNIVHPPTSWSS